MFQEFQCPDWLLPHPWFQGFRFDPAQTNWTRRIRIRSRRLRQQIKEKCSDYSVSKTRVLPPHLSSKNERCEIIHLTLLPRLPRLPLSYHSLMLPLLCALSMASSTQDVDSPDIPREFRAAWVATVDNIDWPSSRTLTTDQQKAEMVKILDTAVALKLNAIILQVRPSCDALYDSKLEPWSEYLTGLQGRAPSPYYDPLEFAVDEAHARGLEIHCWFNPYRANHPAQKGPLAKTHINVQHPEIVKKYGRYLWLDPGEPLVLKHSLAVIRDVVHRYDIDGVHIDDYFYPYPENGQEFPDDPSYERYTKHGGKLNRNDWRRENVDKFVEGAYKEIKAEKKWVKFGISPFGIYRPGYPATIKAGIDQYAELYADCKKWLNNGWCDYMSPQLYWPIAQTAQSYPVLLDWWISENTMGRHIWPGLYTSRLGSEGSRPWNVKEIVDQISLTRQRSAATGEVHFSMKVFLQNRQNVNSVLGNGLYQHRALVPASPWLGEDAPAAPKVTTHKGDDGKWVLEFKPGSRHPVRFYTVRVKITRWLEPRITSNEEMTLGIGAGVTPSAISVTAIDRVGNQSEPKMVTPSLR